MKILYAIFLRVGCVYGTVRAAFLFMYLNPFGEFAYGVPLDGLVLCCKY